MNDIETLRQIGMMTVYAVSGGRIESWADHLRLPCGQSRRVEIRLNGRDLYDVRRVRTINRGTRRGDEVIEYERTDVYCDDISEVVYMAGTWK